MRNELNYDERKVIEAMRIEALKEALTYPQANKPVTVRLCKRQEREFDCTTVGPVVEGQPVMLRWVKRTPLRQGRITTIEQQDRC